MNHCYEPDREQDELQHTILCNLCSHKRAGRTCEAFPDGIPMEILRSNEHYSPFPGDHSIVFERKR